MIVAIICGVLQGASAESVEQKILNYGGTRKDFTIEGRPAFVIFPDARTTQESTPWVWYAPTLTGRHPDESHEWLFSRLLKAGFAIGGVDVGESYGNPEGRKIYQAYYEHVVSKFSLSPKACLLPQSRGGLMLYNWAAEYPDEVQCIAGIYTVCDPLSWPGAATACSAYGMTAEKFTEHAKEHTPLERLEPLARYGVPILHVHGDTDTVVPLERNSGELIRRYCALGGPARLEIIPGKGHEVCDEFFKNEELLSFLLKQGNLELLQENGNNEEKQ